MDSSDSSDHTSSARTENPGKLVLDFIHDKVNYLRPLPKGKNELIAKAIGIAKGLNNVIDATAGLGMDAVVMARLGCQVRSVERSPEVFALLKDAYARALTEEDPAFKIWLTRLQFLHADSIQYLQALATADRPQVIYMDPMFPEKKKSALPRKEMVLFRSLVGDDEDATELLKVALITAKERVVVKRPLKADPLLREPNHRFEGKSVRYDLYLVK